MFLHKRKSSGRFYLHFTDNGRKRSITTKAKSKSDALLFVKRWERKLTEADTAPVKRVMLKQYIDEYLKHIEITRRPDTVNTYKQVLNSFYLYAGNPELISITGKTIEEYIIIKQANTSPGTARVHHSVLSAFFNKAINWQYIRCSPTMNIQKPLASPGRVQYLNRDELARLLAAINSAILIQLFSAAALTGLRAGEIINLTWEAVDFERRTITIGLDFKTKSGKTRTVPISNTTYTILRDREHSKRGDYVFHRDGYQYTRFYISKQFKIAVVAAGLNPALCFHSLRHTCASWLIQSGVPIDTARKILGHSTTSMTERYSHLGLLQYEAAALALNFDAPGHGGSTQKLVAGF